MTDDNTVWVAEAWLDNERVERVVHTTEHDARHDIEIVAPEGASIEVAAETLYLGEDEHFEVSR